MTGSGTRLEAPTYPETRREETSETAGGVVFADPYRWLEDDAAASDWDAAQNSLTRTFVQTWEHYGTVVETMNVPGLRFPGGQGLPTVLGPFPCGRRWLHFVLRGEEFPQLHVSQQPFAPGSVALDPDQLPDGHPRWMKWVQASPNGRLAAICFMRDVGGRQPEVVRVLDLERAELLPDWIEGPHFVGEGKLAWLADSSGFFYLSQGKPSGPPRWRPGHVAFHRLGSAAEDENQLRFEHTSASLQASPDQRYLTVIQGFASPRAEYINDLATGGGWKPFLADVVGRAHGAFAGDRYVAVVVEGAPKGRVVSIPVESAADRATWTELVPESDRVVWSVDVVQDTLIVGLSDDSGQQLSLFGLDGSPRGQVPLEPGTITSPGSVRGRGVSPFPGGFMFWHNTFTAPPAAYRYNLAESSLSTLVPAPPVPDTEMRVLDCSAADGTRLRVRVIYRADLDLSEPRPLLLSGYANLNQIFVNPAEAWGAFLDAGGIFAWATLPGGGEFGTSWWRAANQRNIGRRGRDLASVAEFLIAAGFTTSGQLAITGGSGGGVLTSMAITQRPDLFKAAAILFPQTDFARFTRDPSGRSWLVNEWGDPEDPEVAPVIREWSPYHNVRPGERYPATLLLVGTEDGICPPWHSRKLVAALQGAGSPEPVLYRIVPGLAHGAAEPAAVQAMAVEPLAFVMRVLGMAPAGAHNKPASDAPEEAR